MSQTIPAVFESGLFRPLEPVELAEGTQVVVQVSPAPDASQLLVLVASAIAGDRPDPDAVLERLAAVAGRLRGEVAAAITRRRAPKLLFQFVAGPSGEEVQR